MRSSCSRLGCSVLTLLSSLVAACGAMTTYRLPKCRRFLAVSPALARCKPAMARTTVQPAVGSLFLRPQPEQPDGRGHEIYPQWQNSQVCGTCVDVAGPKGTVTVRIVDLCPECKSGDLNLSEQAFTMIADRAAGRVRISWVPVACAVSGPIGIHFKEGSNAYWMAVQIRNSRLQIRIELQQNGNWVSLVQQSYNYYVADNPDPGPGPYTFRITATSNRANHRDWHSVPSRQDRDRHAAVQLAQPRPCFPEGPRARRAHAMPIRRWPVRLFGDKSAVAAGSARPLLR